MTPTRRQSPWMFLLVVLLLSIPFYGLGATGGRLPILTVLPTSALMAFTPMIAALVLAYRDGGLVGATDLLNRAIDFGRVRNKRTATVTPTQTGRLTRTPGSTSWMTGLRSRAKSHGRG